MTIETIEIVLPKNETTLAFLALHQREKVKCIELGMSFLSHGIKTLQTWDNAGWAQKLNNMENELERAREKNRQILMLHAEEKKTLGAVIRSSESARYNGEIDHLNAKMRILETRTEESVQKYHNLHQKLTTEFDQRHRSREERYENKINSLEKRVEMMRLANEELAMRGQCSTFLGQDGEKLTCQALNCLFPKAEIIDTHAEGGKGDFILKEGNMCCMIETKNHKTNVGRLDIDKFYNDIETNDEVKCGVFASLKSGVVNRGDFQLEFRNNKPVFFLTHVKDNMKHLVVAMKFFETLINIQDIDMSQKEKIDRIQHLIPVIKRKWATIRSKFSTLYTTTLQLLLEQEKTFDECIEIMLKNSV